MSVFAATDRTGAIPQAERSLAPDLARGLTLWFIALANVGSYLYGRPVAGVGWCPVDGDRGDHALDLLVALFVHERSFPLFAILLGYGLATITHRLTTSGVPVGTLRWVLIRRGLGLITLGAIHAALLFHGDVLGLYGLTSLFALPLLRRGVARAVWIVLAWVYSQLRPPASRRGRIPTLVFPPTTSPPPDRGSTTGASDPASTRWAC
jgi:uncharacterized membrane protein YeiB